MSNRRKVPPSNRRTVLAADAELLAARLRVNAQIEPSPATVAYLDQRAARDRDVLTGIRPALAEAGITVEGPPLSADTFAVLLVAARARVRQRCPHIRAREPWSTPGSVHLSQGTWACDRCPAVPVMPDGTVLLVNDHRCDLCDTPPPDDRFHSFVVTVAGVTFIGAVGSCCAARLGIEDAA